MIISKGVIKKQQLDSNKHLNVSEYIKFADKQNSELLKDFKKKKFYLITRHEIYNLDKKKISSICNFFLIPLNKKNKKIFEMSTEEVNKLKKKIEKNYHNPFR